MQNIVRGIVGLLSLALCSARAGAHETVWVEAEWLHGITGYCWPMGKPEVRKTNGHWGLSGPGWAAEWTQGGESMFMSVACGPGDDKGVVTRDVEVPADGTYRVWVRYADWRERPERFQVKLEQGGAPAWTGTYGERAVVEEDNELKLYWDWAFAWDQRQATLKKGAAKLSLLSAFADDTPRQVDVIVLTTDEQYRPLIKEQPAHPSTQCLAEVRAGNEKVEPLARGAAPSDAPAAWKPRTFRDKGFLYLWNVPETVTWLGDDPKRVLYPYNLRDEEAIKAFEAKYGGAKDVPIFSDPRIVPTFHSVGPELLQTDSPDPKVREASLKFKSWLDADPSRVWATMMNYHPDTPLSPAAYDNFMKYRDRYVGSIAGESLGYFYPDAKQMEAATANATTRRQLVEAFTPVDLASNAAKYKAVLGRDLDAPYRDVISCLSCGLTQFAPLTYLWGARTVGYESAAATSAAIGMRTAFLRGAARQNEGMTATYRSSNFGDSATIFSKASTYSGPENVYENYYSVYSGAGMTWYKMDIWYQYMAGSSMFYHEQGFDEFWMPGGTTIAGRRDVELSPKGKLVDRFLRTTAAEPDRGTPYTPVAFLVDYAHGWEPTAFWPGEWVHHHIARDKTPIDDHWLMMKQYMWAAYYPLGPASERPMTSTNEVYVPGVFGDIFDVTCAYPDVSRWKTIDTYPVVIVTGDIELTTPEGERLAQYIENGGTALIADAQLTGPGVAALKLPALGAAAESTGYRWGASKDVRPSQRYAFKPITPAGGQVLASSAQGQPICASFDRGKGRLVFVSVPRGMGIDRQVIPVIPRLFAGLTAGLMPVKVRGDVEWSVNRTDKGWVVTLLNPAGQLKPQQGITPTDFRENRQVTIESTTPIAKAHDRLLPTDTLSAQKAGEGGSVTLTVPAGAVRVIQLD